MVNKVYYYIIIIIIIITALEKGFEKLFPVEGTSSNETNIHLRCFDHVKTDMLLKLTSLKIERTQQMQIIRDILGEETSGRQINGLVDCDSEWEFDRELA